MNLSIDNESAIYLIGLSVLAVCLIYLAVRIFRSGGIYRPLFVSLPLAMMSLVFFCGPLTEIRADEASTDDVAKDELGGLSVTLRVLPQASWGDEVKPLEADAVSQAILTIEQRLNSRGTEDLIIQQQGADRIMVQMPGTELAEVEAVRVLLESIAKLELRLVHEESRTLAPEVAADPQTNLIPGYKLYHYESTDRDGNAVTEDLLLRNRTVIDGSYITRAQALYGAYAGQIVVELNDKGGEILLATTKKAKPGQTRMAIVLDGKVLSAPSINGVFGSSFQISGMDSLEEAQALSAALMNPLKNPVTIEEVRWLSAK